MIWQHLEDDRSKQLRILYSDTLSGIHSVRKQDTVPVLTCDTGRLFSGNSIGPVHKQDVVHIQKQDIAPVEKEYLVPL